jgi:hypothetical protein
MKASTLLMPPCPLHKTPTVCPRCNGAKGGLIGGRAKSPRKTRAARRNARQPRPRDKEE